MTVIPGLQDARALDPAKLASLLALNNAHAAELSFLTAQRLGELLAIAWLGLATDDGSAMLISFDNAAAYDSPNFLWFRDRWPCFAYIDRVVVAPEARGRGLARALYQRALARAADDKVEWVFCEVNLYPPNPASDAFHAALGFVEVGRSEARNAGKVVRYLARPVTCCPGAQRAVARPPPGGDVRTPLALAPSESVALRVPEQVTGSAGQNSSPGCPS